MARGCRLRAHSRSLNTEGYQWRPASLGLLCLPRRAFQVNNNRLLPDYENLVEHLLATEAPSFWIGMWVCHTAELLVHRHQVSDLGQALLQGHLRRRWRTELLWS